MFNFGLKEDGGDWSSTRVNALIAVLLVCAIVIKSLFSDKEASIELVITLLSYAAGSKVAQKFAEVKAQPIQQQPDASQTTQN